MGGRGSAECQPKAKRTCGRRAGTYKLHALALREIESERRERHGGCARRSAMAIDMRVVEPVAAKSCVQYTAVRAVYGIA